MALTMYGIRNCDTVKRARAWLDARGMIYRFHDYKTAGLERGQLERWCRELGWEALLNRSGTTFRKLPERAKQSLEQGAALELMLAQPSLVRRPVLETASGLLVGFRPDRYAEVFGSAS